MRFGSSLLHRTIQEAATYIADLDARRKSIIVVTEGMADALGLFDNMRARPHPSDPINKPKYVPWEDYELLAMMNAVRRANAAIYAVDPRGRLQTPQERFRESHGGNDVFRFLDSLHLSKEGLKLIAEASGGFAIVDTNELTAGVSRIVDDLSHYYLLGFHPKESGKDWRELRVEVDRPGVSVRHRKGYQIVPARTKRASADPGARALEGLLPSTDERVRLFATAVQDLGRDTRVSISADVDGAPGDAWRFELAAVDLDRKHVVKRLQRAFDAAATPAAGRPAWHTSIELRSGRPYQIRVSALNQTSGRTGSAYLTLELPEIKDEQVAVLGAALRSVDDTNLNLLTRRFGPLDSFRFVYWVSAAAEATPVDVELRTADGAPVRSLEPVVQNGTGAVDVSLAGLQPGIYRIGVRLGEEAHQVREIGFLVGPDERHQPQK